MSLGDDLSCSIRWPWWRTRLRRRWKQKLPPSVQHLGSSTVLKTSWVMELPSILHWSWGGIHWKPRGSGHECSDGGPEQCQGPNFATSISKDHQRSRPAKRLQTRTHRVSENQRYLKWVWTCWNLDFTNWSWVAEALEKWHVSRVQSLGILTQSLERFWSHRPTLCGKKRQRWNSTRPLFLGIYFKALQPCNSGMGRNLRAESYDQELIMVSWIVLAKLIKDNSAIVQAVATGFSARQIRWLSHPCIEF